MRLDRSTYRSIVDMLSARRPGLDEVEAVYAPFQPGSHPLADQDGGGGRGGRGGYRNDHKRDFRAPAADPSTAPVTREGVLRLLEYLGAPGSGYVALGAPTDTVDVSLSASGVRFTMPQGPPTTTAVPSASAPGHSAMRKERVRPAVGVPEYRLRFNLKRETPLIGADLAAALSDPLASGPTRGPDTARTYRLKRRYSFVPEEDDATLPPTTRFDVTTVRQTTQSGRGEMPPTFAALSRASETYEVEVECVSTERPSPESSEDLAREMLARFSEALNVLDDTDVLMSVGERAAVISGYEALVGSRRFVGPKPVTLELRHLACSPLANANVPCVTRDYTVTDKADGERRFLFVAKDRHVYTIDDRLFVRATGLVSRRLADCLLDGEHVSGSPGRFLAFDAFFIGGEDVRSLPLLQPLDAATTTKRRSSAKKDKKEDRLSAATAVVAVLVRAATAEIDADMTTDVSVKRFERVSDADSLAEACKRLFKAKKGGYEVDGIIFTPALLPAPVGSGTWSAALKWKPPEQNTIDFQVRLRGESHLAAPRSSSETYSVAELLVGHDPWLASPLTALDVLSGRAKERLVQLQRRGRAYDAVPFAPPTGENDLHVCYLRRNAGGRCMCENGVDEIVDGAIVEFAYDAKRSPAPARWVPLHVRWDKMGTGSIRANNAVTANVIWDTIVRPVTREALTDSAVAAAAIAAAADDAAKVGQQDYYVSQLGAEDGESSSGGLRRFHNFWVKRTSLLMRFPASAGLGRSVFDFGCGRGGDLPKWIEMGATRVVGIDRYASNLYDPSWPVAAAYVRLLQAKGHAGRTGAPVPPSKGQVGAAARAIRVAFLPMDASKPVASLAYADGLDEASGDRAVARALFGHDPVAAVQPSALREYHRFASNPVDLATCMFAIHYFFEKPEALTQFAANVSSALRPGGHFVGCCLDGALVDELLRREAPGLGDSVRSSQGAEEGERPAWRITRRYEGSAAARKPPPKKAVATKRGGGESNFGRRIDVYMESIGQELPEFLVDYADLVSAMAAAGLRPVDAAEATALGLSGGAATGTFDALFEDMKREYAGTRSLPPPVAAAMGMSDDEKRVSFMNRWFVFKKDLFPRESTPPPLGAAGASPSKSSTKMAP